MYDVGYFSSSIQQSITRLFLLSWMFFLSSCATSYVDVGGRLHFVPKQQQIDALKEKTACCEHYWELPFKRVSLDKTYEFQINSELPVYDFRSGKSYVLALEVPLYYKSFKLKIDSYFDDSVFYPTVAILNDRYFAIKKISDKAIRRENRSKFSRSFISGQIDVNETEEIAKYVLIYTTKDLLDSKFVINPAARYGYDVHPGPEGRIKIKFVSDP